MTRPLEALASCCNQTRLRTGCDAVTDAAAGYYANKASICLSILKQGLCEQAMQLVW